MHTCSTEAAVTGGPEGWLLVCLSASVFDREGWQVLLSKARMDPKSLGPAETAVLRALYDWRDQVRRNHHKEAGAEPGGADVWEVVVVVVQFARSSDESVLYVCSDRTLLRIAQIMPRTFDSLQVRCQTCQHRPTVSPC